MNRRHLLLYICVPLALLAAYAAFAWRLLGNAGEYLPPRDVAVKLNETYGYYGPALADRTFHYKKALYNLHKPEVAALGSSRVLALRGESFNVSFVNLGGMRGLAETDEIARALFAGHAPKLLLLGADFRWFAPEDLPPAPRAAEIPQRAAGDLFRPLLWMLGGDIDIARLVDGDVPDAGAIAIARRDGFDRFGAYYNTSLWTGERDSDDKKFETSLARIRKGEGDFAGGERLSPERIGQFQELLRFLKERKIKVVLFLPPVAPTVVAALEASGQHGYISKAEEKLKKLAKAEGIPFFTFHDPRALGAGDCEFTDGLHGGQIVYDRILLHLAAWDADVRKAVRLPETGFEISRFSGRASSLPDEVDFLALGCRKSVDTK